ncbi:fimbrial protein [Pseudomonas wadenswilerensis]|uniref:fimbrial protein n=1 Tax=Pseudomonas wadenswilerensis TaxID=1785161 RepID=UPI003209D610
MTHKKQNRLLSLLFLGTTLAFAHLPSTWAADCVFTDTHKTFTANYINLPINNLTIPADAPNGTVIYEESIMVPSQGFRCDTSAPFIFSLNPTLGSVTSGSVFPLGKTGLSLKIKNDQNGYLTANRILAGQSYLDPARNYTIEIIKSSSLSSQNTIPAGYLGAHVWGRLELVKVNLVNPITLSSASCRSPSVQVEMGSDYRLHEFGKAGDTPRIIKFNISLDECQRGIKTVTYSLKATSKVLDQKKGLVALNLDSTAKGVGLQLMNETGQPIALDTTYTFSEFDPAGTNFKIPLSAAYYRLAETQLEAGTANASVTFIMNYL